MSEDNGGAAEGGEGATNAGAGEGGTNGAGNDKNATAALGGDGAASGQGTRFLDSVSEEFRVHPSMKNFEDVNQLAKSYINAQQLIGADKAEVFRKPRSADDKEGWDGYYRSLGRPETADDYALPQIENWDWNKDSVGEFNKVAHNLGLNAAQYEGIMKWHGENMLTQSNASHEQAEQIRTATLAKLQEEWGEAYQVNDKRVQLAIDKVMGADFKELAEATGLALHPQFYIGLAKIGALVEEGGEINIGGGGVAGAKTPAEARAEIKLLESDRAFVKRLKAGDAEAVAKRDRLYKAAYPEPQKKGA